MYLGVAVAARLIAEFINSGQCVCIPFSASIAACGYPWEWPEIYQGGVLPLFCEGRPGCDKCVHPCTNECTCVSGSTWCPPLMLLSGWLSRFLITSWRLLANWIGSVDLIQCVWWKLNHNATSKQPCKQRSLSAVSIEGGNKISLTKLLISICHERRWASHTCLPIYQTPQFRGNQRWRGTPL